ncbi:hypothetical protein Ahy_B08g089628 isoform B [Arachis hypogaea]|uniref:Uncharacterized protein n=1 Tax=Arachis hypogaea TaxID=3818 RepID=A0A444XYC6_ARAHY|nr:hypothetical protein Ahy_B08g089628 isoform B [Arachis hypogaea]
MLNYYAIVRVLNPTFVTSGIVGASSEPSIPGGILQLASYAFQRIQEKSKILQLVLKDDYDDDDDYE